MDFKIRKYFCKRSGGGELLLLQIICSLPENTPKNIKTKELFAHNWGFTDFECGFDLRSLSQREQTGQTDLTFKLDFPGNLCEGQFSQFLRCFNLSLMKVANMIDFV